MSVKDPVSNPSGVISINAPILTPKQEQVKWLCEGIEVVEEKAAIMRAHIFRREFEGVLRNSVLMLAELRTDMLAPQYYYELYLKVFDHIQHLELYFEEEHSRGRSLKEMYEVVQHTGNIVPRLYLLITVGSVYIKSGEQPVIDIMHDLLEMCKGVQDPIHGLFLRHFLLTMMKNKLPGDSNRVVVNIPNNDGGTVEDTAELILQNFKEMNWLWIRIETNTQFGATEIMSLTERKQKDRRELCVLVGMNIVRISQLEGVERQVYKKVIFPRLVEIILKYKEPLAQRYLLDVIVQVFPDEFHLFTLDELFDALENVSNEVDICAILISLIKRLTNYASLMNQGVAVAGSHKEEKLLRKMFDIFRRRIDAIFDTNNLKKAEEINYDINNVNGEFKNGGYFISHKFPLLSYLRSMLCLVNFSLNVEPELAVEHIGIVFSSIAERFDCQERYFVIDTLQQIIVTVIENIKDPTVVLNLTNIETVINLLPNTSKRMIAVAFCKASVQSVTYRITNFDTCTRLFELITPLLYDDTCANNNNNNNNTSFSEFSTEQHLLCRVLHLLQSDDVSTQLKLLNGTRKLLGQFRSKSTIVTMPTVASLYINLALRIAKIIQEEKKENNIDKDKKEENSFNGNNIENNNVIMGICTKTFNAIHSGNGKGILEMLAVENPIETFYLYLTSANTADVCKLQDIAYEHYISAFQLYEENAAEMRNQIEMVTCIINSLQSLRNMCEENYELLATKVCQYSSKLMRKGDQSRLVMLCAHLFWKKSFSEESHSRVVECLRRSLKIANYIQETQQFLLFVELLNYVLHYYAGNAPGVTVNYISPLINILKEKSTINDNDNDKDSENDSAKTSEETCSNNDSYFCDLNKENKKDNCLSARIFYHNTTRYICSRQEVDERWKEIGVLEEKKKKTE